jgi:hypothetical protein
MQERREDAYRGVAERERATSLDEASRGDVPSALSVQAAVVALALAGVCAATAVWLKYEMG